MNSKTIIMRSHMMRSYKWIGNAVILCALIWTCIQTALHAQEYRYSKPLVWIGAAAAANVNFYRGSTQNLNDQFTSPVAFHQGTSVGLYVAPLIELHLPSGIGLMLQVGYDSRRGSFDQEITSCNCPADLSTKLSYISVEPSLRFAPNNGNFYLFGGPRVAFNVDRSFTYKLGINPDIPDQLPTPDVNGDLSNINNTLVSMQIGAGYDIPISSQNNRTQLVFSPFVSFQPYFGQEPRSTETWNLTTLRIGAALKFGSGKLILPAADLVRDVNVAFTVKAPKNIPTSRRVREIFPLRNYVFFDLGSTEIPERYVILKKSQVKDFKEDQLDLFTPKNLSGRSERQMIVYYNVINILGDRMEKNPSSTITLVGSSEKGPDDGKLMAESIERYLIDIFGINDSRITTQGRDKPKLPSEQPGSTMELDLLREGDRRVSIESSSPTLLMEFQGGPYASLKPVEIIAMQEEPLDSYVTFNADGAQKAFSSWSLEIMDEAKNVQRFGPYFNDKVRMSGKNILGNRSEGDYEVTMVGLTKNGESVRKTTSVNMVKWTPTKIEEGMRFSILFEFDESKAIGIYEKYLTDIVAPKIPKNATVYVHGYTDVIGEEIYNQSLSLERANAVKSILEKQLKNLGRNDVRFEVDGYGEDLHTSPFDNEYPEERFYNRTVIIDIIPNN